MSKKTVISKRQPDWLKRIARDHLVTEQRAIQGRIKLIETRLVLEDTIEQINAKFNTTFTLNDIFSITEEESDEVMDLMDEE
mgnify:CR=1 FL=1